MITICIRAVCARHMAISSDQKRQLVLVRVFATGSVAWNVENMSDENMLQDREIILVILAFQKCRGLKSKNSTRCQRQYFCQRNLHKSCVKRHNVLDVVVGILILNIVTQRIDKIGQQTVTNCHIFADCPNDTNY